jgi:hypothetical protein
MAQLPGARNFAGVPDDETQLMVCGNAAKVYGPDRDLTVAAWLPHGPAIGLAALWCRSAECLSAGLPPEANEALTMSSVS